MPPTQASTASKVRVTAGHESRVKLPWVKMDSAELESECSVESKTKVTELERVKNQIALYTQKVHNEKRRLEILNERIAEYEAKQLLMQQQSQSRRGINAAGVKKQISSLENRLNKSLVAFNTKVTANKELRR